MKRNKPIVVSKQPSMFEPGEIDNLVEESNRTVLQLLEQEAVLPTTTEGPVSRTPDHDESTPVIEVSEVKETTLTQRTDALIRGLDLILEHHGAPQDIRRATWTQVHAYLGTLSYESVEVDCPQTTDVAALEKQWVKQVKYLLAYPLAQYLHNELPPPPSTGAFEPTGCLRRWMRERLRIFSRRNTHLWYSWYQAKRSCLPMSEHVVEATYLEHNASLRQSDPGCPHTINEIFEDPAFLHVLDIVREQARSTLRLNDFVRGRTSNSASFEATRKMGGQHAVLLAYASLEENMSMSGDLARMTYDPLKGVTTYRHRYGYDEWLSLIPKIHDYDLHNRPLRCVIQAVLEPMKVRVISKGESLPYYSMRPLQKVLHSTLRKMEPFRLIGRPFCPTDIMDLRKLSDPTDEWFSIDYSAATDGLSWDYSGRILRYIIQDLPNRVQQIALRVLGPHDLFYPSRGARSTILAHRKSIPGSIEVSKFGKSEYCGTQENGQLMGSILSFPILCLANLGVYLRTTQSHHENWTIKERLSHVLVNGDDMVYAAPPDLWQDHIHYGKRVGLKMSIGKAYHHSTYLNINSTSVHCNLQEDETPWQIPFLNTGLFFGQHKVLGGDEGDGSLTISSTASNKTIQLEENDQGEVELKVHPLFEYALAHYGVDPRNGLVTNLNATLKGSLPGRHCLLLRRFLQEHAAAVHVECLAPLWEGSNKLGTRNMFLPIALGGMGVDPPCNWRFKISKDDHDRMSYLMSKGVFDCARPLRGKEEIEVLENEPWTKPSVETPDFVMPRKKRRESSNWSMIFPTCFVALRRVLIDPYIYPLSYTISELSWTITELSWSITETCICH